MAGADAAQIIAHFSVDGGFFLGVKIVMTHLRAIPNCQKSIASDLDFVLALGRPVRTKLGGDCIKTPVERHSFGEFRYVAFVLQGYVAEFSLNFPSPFLLP